MRIKEEGNEVIVSIPMDSIIVYDINVIKRMVKVVYGYKYELLRIEETK